MTGQRETRPEESNDANSRIFLLSICEFNNPSTPSALTINSRILDFLDGGIASSSRVDGLGKGIGEFLRSRTVEIPEVFLERGRI